MTNRALVRLSNASEGAADRDEYYTNPYDVVEGLQWVEAHATIPHDVYCPCDTRESAFTRCFAQAGYHVEFASSDFRYQDFTGKFIATNPPFSLFVGSFYPKLRREAAGFLVVAPLTALYSPRVFADLKAGRVHAFTTHGTSWKFTRPDGTLANAPACWLTSLDVPADYMTGCKIPAYAELEDYPCEWRGYRVKHCPALPLPLDAPAGALIAAPASVLAELTPHIVLVAPWRTRYSFERVVIAVDRMPEIMLF